MKLAGVLVLFLLVPCVSGFGAEDFTVNLSFEIPAERANLSTIYVSEGSSLDLVEELVSRSVGMGVFQLEYRSPLGGGTYKSLDKVFVSDELSLLDDVKRNGTLLVVVGGAGNNRIAGYLIEKGYVESTQEGSLFNTLAGAIPNSTQFVILDHESVMGVERKAVENSPLKGIIDDAYIPVAATGVGILLSALSNLLKTVFEFKMLDFGRKGRKLYKNRYKGVKVRLVEAAAILGASTALGIGVTWTFHASLEGGILARNIGICLLAALSHEVSHRLVGRMFGIHIEYHFWSTGSFITVLTGYLGNSFGIQGFLMEEMGDDVEDWKKGLTKLAAPLFSTAVMVVFAYLNYLGPDELYQTIYSIAGLWAMAEILPFKPLDGYDVRKWSKFVWSVSFTAIAVLFCAITFVL